MINFRLADSLPSAVVQKWQAELAGDTFNETDRTRELRRRIDTYLDAGHGACWLQRPEIAELIQHALLYFDAARYCLLAWCIMPNHVHVLIETKSGYPLAEVLQCWKSYTSSEANKMLGRRGNFWQREYLDRFIRNAEHYSAVISYIEENPVVGGLVKLKTDWPWSSARYRL